MRHLRGVARESVYAVALKRRRMEELDLEAVAAELSDEYAKEGPHGGEPRAIQFEEWEPRRQLMVALPQLDVSTPVLRQDASPPVSPRLPSLHSPRAKVAGGMLAVVQRYEDTRNRPVARSPTKLSASLYDFVLKGGV
jgi:hypothetical protein